MSVPVWVWISTVGVSCFVLTADVFVIARRPHNPGLREISYHLVFYVGLALLFGIGVWYFSGAKYAGEFFAGWLTEYSLSVDNLFIFLLIMRNFAVPRQYQQTALMVGIILALVLRGIFIGLGAAAINAYSGMFYLFGFFLIYTAIKLAREKDSEDQDFEEGRFLAYVEKHIPITQKYHGAHLFVKNNGRRLATPMFIVFIALGTTDVLFALDSIPAIYGLTREPYLVLMANIFALMGLRQLFFLIGGLLERLVYLSYGLAFLLAFIGLKLIFHAMHENTFLFINDGRHITWAPQVPIWISLLVIIVTLAITAIASLLANKKQVI